MSVQGIITDHAFRPHPDLKDYCGCGAALYLHASEGARPFEDSPAPPATDALPEAEDGDDLPAGTPAPGAGEVTPGEGWRIRDLDELNRVLGRMARIDRIREENREVVAKEIARKQEWLAKEDEALAKRYRDLAAHVEAFARDNREALGKTRRLPNGVVAWKERKEGAYRWRQDMTPKEREAALLEWAKSEQSSTLRPLWDVVGVERPNLDTIKAHLGTRAAALQDSPRAPPGLEWVGPGESLSIVVGGK